MKNWPWKIYGVILSSMITNDIASLLNPQSSFKHYYTVLIGLNKLYILALALNLADILINTLCVLVVFYYAFEIPNTHHWWKKLFIARIVLDLVGNNYFLQFIKASFFQSTWYGLGTLIFLTLPIIPSYIAHYLYIRKKR